MPRITGAKFEKMKNAMRAVIDHFGGPRIVNQKAEEQKFSRKRLLWDLWRVATDNLRYDDTHPMFASGKMPRIIPQEPTFDMYSNDDNDDHIETALKAIGKSFGV